MKFKYVGTDGCFCIELLAYKIIEKDEPYMKNGDIIDVPDEYPNVIASMDVSGLFKRVEDNKKITKKVVKKDKEDKE